MKKPKNSLEIRQRKKEWLIKLQLYKKILLPNEQDKTTDK
jgi:hypothetical protein